MKKIYFLFFLISMNVFSQNILLNFEGKRKGTNESVTLEKVIIENLTANKAVVLEGETSFNIGNTLSTEDFLVNELNRGIVSVFPNPVVSEATIVLNSLGEGLAKIEVYDLSGKSLISIQKEFSKGQHEIQFKPGKTGIYFVKFSDKDQYYFSKVISIGGNDGKDMLRYVGQHKVNNQLKIQSKKNNNDFFNDDDVLRITVFNGNEKSVIYDSPKESKNYTFFFDDNFFRFEEYLVQSNYPSFVDVMFSVTDSNYKGVDYLENDDFKVLENGSEINKLESFRYVKKLSQVPSKQRTVLMLDKSLSVQENLPTIKEAAIKLIEKIADEQEVAIYSFSENAELLIDFTNDKELLRMAIDEIRVDFPTTNLYGSVIEGLHKINNRYSLDGIEEGYLVVLTDGDDTQASSTLDQVVNARGTKRVFMIGLGEGLNEDNLNEIAYPGNYIKATDANELDEKFDEIRFDMLRFANSFYWLNYMSPKRDSQNTLTVEAINNTNTGEDRNITNTFDSSNFESVTSGVYANVSVGEPYGISTIDLLVEDENTVASIDLKAYTYWAKEVPEYVWTIDNQESFELIINEDDDTKAVLKTKSDNYDTGTLLLEDTANDYSYEIAVNLLTVKPSLEVNVSDIEARKAKFNGEITYTGSTQITENGFQLFFEDELTPIKEISLASVNTSIFSIQENLRPGHKYRIRSYSDNENGRGFSEELEFTTLTSQPLLDRIFLPSVNGNSIELKALVLDLGGLTKNRAGFCYSTTNTLPTLSDSVVEEETFEQLNSGAYHLTSTMMNLTQSTTYYIRAFVENDLGLSYSDPIEVTTTNGLDVEMETFFQKSQTSVFNFTFFTKEEVVEAGLVWSKESSEPNIDNDSFTIVDLNDDASPAENKFEFEDTLLNINTDDLYNVRYYVKTPFGVVYSVTINNIGIYGDLWLNDVSGSAPVLSNKTATSIDLEHKYEYRNNFFNPEIIQKGFCLSKVNEKPNLSDIVVESTNSSEFDITATATNLEANTQYYARSFVRSINGSIYYSNAREFATNSDTYTGDLFFKTQTEIDNFNLSEDILQINGTLFIASNQTGNNAATDKIIDISKFKNIESITSLFVVSTDLVDLNGFEKLKSLSRLEIGDNEKLVSAELSVLEEVNSISIFRNSVLSILPSYLFNAENIGAINITGLESLSIDSLELPNLISVGSLVLSGVDFITVSIPKLEKISLLTINNCNLIETLNVPNLTGFDWGNSAYELKRIDIQSNNQLTNLSFLENLKIEEGVDFINKVQFVVRINNSLNDFCGVFKVISSFNTLSEFRAFDIQGNLYNPTFEDLKTGQCSN